MRIVIGEDSALVREGLAKLLIDAGHDVRVSRILLGRINSALHRTGSERTDKAA